jgi:hypothetical protein
MLERSVSLNISAAAGAAAAAAGAAASPAAAAGAAALLAGCVAGAAAAACVWSLRAAATGADGAAPSLVDCRDFAKPGGGLHSASSPTATAATRAWTASPQPLECPCLLQHMRRSDVGTSQCFRQHQCTLVSLAAAGFTVASRVELQRLSRLHNDDKTPEGKWVTTATVTTTHAARRCSCQPGRQLQRAAQRCKR